ncbi:hypothetical protein HPB47_011134 [Ixodes persulcatus]|uniref:Uncharacterized protein n=1 Tax=Ixodes persulcatus TaxID=34615 RepID=A0AC60NX76_IXOPE|nr:hypothetical protein HPB47_011134 [Ixodes persulcatus]
MLYSDRLLSSYWMDDKPVVQLRLGSGLNPASIHEGIDIYFECTVRANPGVSEVSWQFNRKDLHTDGGRGVIVSNQSLALRSVNRTNSGFYACLAANTEGEAESNRLKLRVLQVVARLSAGAADDYDKVKSSLLKRYRISAEAFRQRFRNASKKSSEGYSEFAYGLKPT